MQRPLDSNSIKNNFNPNDKPQRPKSWLLESILVTFFCCVPFGIAGIVLATKVESRYNIGDYVGAEEASKEAKKWVIISFTSGLVVVLLYIILFVISGVDISEAGDFF